MFAIKIKHEWLHPHGKHHQTEPHFFPSFNDALVQCTELECQIVPVIKYVEDARNRLLSEFYIILEDDYFACKTVSATELVFGGTAHFNIGACTGHLICPFGIFKFDSKQKFVKGERIEIKLPNTILTEE